MRRLVLACLGLLTATVRGAESAGEASPVPATDTATTVPAAELSGPWTLERALQRAMDANPDLLAAKYQLEREEGVRLQVQSRLLPRLTLSGSTDERDDRSIDRDPGQLSLPPTLRTAVATFGWDVRVEVRQAVFDGLSSWNETQRQRMMAKRAYLTFLDAANRTTALVRQGYDAILMRHNILETERRRIANLTRLVEWTARKESVGEIAQLESLRAQSELETARSELADAEQGLIAAEQSFCRLLQLPDPQGRLQLAGALATREFGLGFDRALSLALKQRPDLEAAELAVRASQYGQKAQRGDYLPKFEVFASYGTRTSYYNSGRTLDGWAIGAAGRWNLFDGLESRGRRRVAAAERRIAEVRRSEVENSITSRLRELYQTLEQARVSTGAQEASVGYAQRALDQARRLYEAGQASLEQVLLAEVAARRAENRLQETIYNYNVAVSQIEYSIGAGREDGAP